MFLTRFFRFLRRLASHLARLRFAAFLRELGAALRRLSLSLRSVLNAGTLRRQLAGRAQGKRVIVFPPTLDWDLPLFQRPQQMARSPSRCQYLTPAASKMVFIASEMVGVSCVMQPPK